MSNGMTSIFMLNIVGFLMSLSTIIVIHYIVGIIIDKIYKRLDSIYMERHKKVVDLLIKLK